MAASFRAAIIGCGPSTEGRGRWHSFSYAHGWAYENCPETKLIAAVSRSKENVDDFSAEFPGATPYQNYHEMLEKEQPNIVSICAWPREREEMVLAAIEAGAKGIWAEKPFALSMASARRMMREVQDKGARIFVNHQRRYGKPFQWMKDAIAEGRIGRLIGIDIVLPGTNLLNMGTHLIDAGLFFMGARKAERVFAAVDCSPEPDYQHVPVERYSLATVHFDDGARMMIEAGENVPSKPAIIRAHGSEGFAELHSEVPRGGQSIFRARFKGEAEVANPSTDEHFHHSEDCALYVKRALADIVRALKTGEQIRIEAREAVRGLEIIMAIYESARTGSMITLPLKQADFPLELMLKERARNA